MASQIDEEKIAINFLKAKESKWRNWENKERAQKMLLFLVRKGFDFEIAKKATTAYNKG